MWVFIILIASATVIKHRDLFLTTSMVWEKILQVSSVHFCTEVRENSDSFLTGLILIKCIKSITFKSNQ